MNKVLDVHSQRFLRERIRIRSRTQSALAAILNDGTGGVADDRVTMSLESQQERGLPRAGASGDHDSRHAAVPARGRIAVTTSPSITAWRESVEPLSRSTLFSIV